MSATVAWNAPHRPHQAALGSAAARVAIDDAASRGLVERAPAAVACHLRALRDGGAVRPRSWGVGALDAALVAGAGLELVIRPLVRDVRSGRLVVTAVPHDDREDRRILEARAELAIAISWSWSALLRGYAEDDLGGHRWVVRSCVATQRAIERAGEHEPAGDLEAHVARSNAALVTASAMSGIGAWMWRRPLSRALSELGALHHRVSLLRPAGPPPAAG